jgi:DNA-binding transcriptional LysR family regulator
MAGIKPLVPDAAPAGIAARTAAVPAVRWIHMELRHLSYSVALAEELHFGRAARRLHVSTPTLSQQIQALEREVGTLLVSRDSHGVTLTSAGKVLLGDAREALKVADRALREARRAGHVNEPAIRLGILHGAPDWLTFQLERVARAALPECRQVLVGGTTADQLALVMSGDIDVALARLPLDKHAVTALPVAEEELGVLMSGQHQLARRAALEPADLADQELIWIHRRFAPGFYDAVLERLHEAGAKLRVSETAVSQAQLPLVLRRNSAAVGLSSERGADPPTLVWRPILGRPLAVTYAVVWREPVRDPAVRELAAALKNTLRRGLLTDDPRS